MNARHHDTGGLSAYICFGNWARPCVWRDGRVFRVCLGWVSFGVMGYDIETLTYGAMDMAEFQKERADRAEKRLRELSRKDGRQ